MTFHAYFPSRRDLVTGLIAELGRILERMSSPDHGSTASDLVAAVRDRWREAIGARSADRSKQRDTIRPYRVAASEAAVVDPEFCALVDRRMEEVASDIGEGLADAGRLEPATRHVCGVLAFAHLHHVARNRARGSPEGV